MIRLCSGITRPSCRCNSVRTANIATRTCRRIRWKRASALTSARSVRTAPRTGFITSARTVAAVLCRGQSGRPTSDGLDYRWRSGHRRASGCICLIVTTISRRFRRVFGIFRQMSVEPTRHCEEPKRRSNPVLLPSLWIASRSLSSGAHSRDPLARNDREESFDASYRLFGSNRFSSPFQQSA
jgi:hypothetical protein